MSNPILSPEMMSDIDAILRSNKHIGEPYASNIDIASGPILNFYNIIASFRGADLIHDTNFEIVPVQISSLKISQLFFSDWTDNIEITIKVTIEQLIILLDCYEDTICELQFTPVLSNNEIVPVRVESHKYKVFIKNSSDIRKSIPTANIVDRDKSKSTPDKIEDLQELTVQLLVPNIYKYTRERVNFIARDCTVSDAICHLARLYKIPYVYMPPSDNTIVYENFIIPPMLNLPEALDHINKYYGVFKDGFNWYYMDDTLFVYPIYQMKMNKNTEHITIHLYNTHGNFPGLAAYHAYAKDGTLHIVLNDEPSVTTDRDSVVEELGNQHIVFDMGCVIDQTCGVKDCDDSDAKVARLGLGKFIWQDHRIYTLESVNDTSGISYNSVIPKYHEDWNNSFTIRAIESRLQTSYLIALWNCAEIYKVGPGYSVTYHYDSENNNKHDIGDLENAKSVYTTVDGSIAGVIYKFEPTVMSASQQVFKCTALLQCLLAPETKITPTNKQFDNLSNSDDGLLQDMNDKGKLY